MEFILGIVSGVVGFWFVAINKFRFALYKNKLDFYFKMNSICTELLLVDTESNDQQEELQNQIKIHKKTQEATSLLLANALLLNDTTIEVFAEYLRCNFLAKSGKEYDEVSSHYDKLRHTIKSDMGFNLLNTLNSINTRTPSQLISKLRQQQQQNKS
jgi:hypothetical protein